MLDFFFQYNKWAIKKIELLGLKEIISKIIKSRVRKLKNKREWMVKLYLKNESVLR